jgi:hypothetical protein
MSTVEAHYTWLMTNLGKESMYLEHMYLSVLALVVLLACYVKCEA